MGYREVNVPLESELDMKWLMLIFLTMMQLHLVLISEGKDDLVDRVLTLQSLHIDIQQCSPLK